jgi:hypothetical protein
MRAALWRRAISGVFAVTTIASHHQYLLTRKAAAAALAVSERTLFGMTAPRGSIPAVHIGRAIRYDARDLVAFIDRVKEGGRP